MRINHLRRREFITLLGGVAAAWPLGARAQQPDRMRRIGVLILTAEDDPLSRERVTAFQQVLEKQGWMIGRNLQIDYRWGISGPEQARTATAALLRLAPDVILANSVSAVRAAAEATRSVPIVFTAVSEPVALGIVKSLARPGGNVTGFTNLEPSVGAKWLELLKEIAPRVARVGLMFNPASTAIASQFVSSAEAAAPKVGLEAFEARIHEPAEIDSTMLRLGREPGAALIVLPDTFLSFHYKLIVELATRYQIPTMYPFRYYVAAGGLISYGPDLSDQFRRAAGYIDQIFRGEKPADLPVQQPTKFEFVINLKTAKALGLTVPLTLQVAADEVIE